MRFRFHGLRKLNWVERGPGDYSDHMVDSDLHRWLEPGVIAVVVGPNGGGKSTVIDLMRSLGDASLWPGLSRENYPGHDFSGFDVEGAGFELSVRFSKYTPKADETFDKVVVTASAKGPAGRASTKVVASRYERDGDWVVRLREVLDVCAIPRPAYLEPFGGRPADELSDEELVRALEAVGRHFPSVLAGAGVAAFKPFSGDRAAASGWMGWTRRVLGRIPGASRVLGTWGRRRGRSSHAGRIGILFKDDPSQHSFVDRQALPLGWLQLAHVRAFLDRCAPRGLILLDEPDRHLHPSLQRVMLEMVADAARRLDAQVFVATHSSVLTNPELCARVDATAFVAARGRFEPLTDARRVLDDLGVTSGDLVQANGVIWVEGPSDRIYVKTWLDRLATSRGREPWVERVHYAFLPYGGSLMKHLTLSDAPAPKLALRAVNRNFVLVMDRDLDVGEDGLRGEKRRLLDEAGALHADDQVWVTEGYTIESYLPADCSLVDRHLDVGGERLKVGGITKVELARRFASEAREWHRSFRAGCDVPDRIVALSKLIGEWQTPQEVIKAPFLPPFLHDPDQDM